MKHVIHVHQRKIKQNEPAIIDRTYKKSTHHRKINILCPYCKKSAAKITQSDVPDHCGARVVIVAQEVNYDDL